MFKNFVLIFSCFIWIQRFIGSSQIGINSLESRVHGLEMALDEISSGRIPNTDSAENTCCKLPGAEFLSSKFWRRAEGRYSSSRFPSSGSIPSPSAMRTIPNKDGNTESYEQVSQRFQHQNRFETVANPLADERDDSRRILRRYSNNMPKNTVQDVERVQVCNASRFNGASPASFTAQRTWDQVVLHLILTIYIIIIILYQVVWHCNYLYCCIL